MNQYILKFQKIKAGLINSSEMRFKIAVICAIVFYVFGKHAIANVFVIAMGLNWLLTKGILRRVKLSLAKTSTWMLLMIFLLTVIGTLYSTDLKNAWRIIEMRLTLLLIPLIFVSTDYSKKTNIQILLTFLYSCIAASIVGLLFSFYNYYITNDSGYFYNDNLVIAIKNQAVYFALYLNICLIIIYWYLQESGYRNKSMWLLVMIYLVLFIFLLASRVSILVSLIIIGFIFYNLFLKRRKVSNIIGMVILLIGSVILLGIIFPKTTKRFRSATSNFHYKFDNPNDVNHFNGQLSEQNWNGLTLRLALWQCGLEIIEESPFLGVGTGDYDIKFREKIEEKNFLYAMKQDFGVHNQYLNIAISFGLFGLCVYLFSIGYLVYDAIGKKNYLFVAIILVFLLGFMTENVLNRYIGILSFSILMTMTYNNTEN